MVFNHKMQCGQLNWFVNGMIISLKEKIPLSYSDLI